MTDADSAGTFYPVNVQVEYPDRSSRVLAALGVLFFIKGLLLLPHALVLCVLGIIGYFAAILAWVAVLITGKYPKSLFDFQVGLLRWNTRLSAWLTGVTDQYPPFRLAE
jgi:hypothetical protein